VKGVEAVEAKAKSFKARMNVNILTFFLLIQIICLNNAVLVDFTMLFLQGGDTLLLTPDSCLLPLISVHFGHVLLIFRTLAQVQVLLLFGTVTLSLVPCKTLALGTSRFQNWEPVPGRFLELELKLLIPIHPKVGNRTTLVPM
jgi:hypothetical protein